MRKRWLAKRVAELFLVVSVMLIVTTQFVHPTVASTLDPVARRDAPVALEKLLALAVPTLIVWLLMFFRGADVSARRVVVSVGETRPSRGRRTRAPPRRPAPS